MSDNYENLARNELIGLLRSRDRARRLGLVWERDEIEHERALTDDLPLVELDAALSRGEGPWRNLLIEGDNFHALRFLRAAIKGSIKCIYIDPPYNTGNKDFIYNDHYMDPEDGFRHSTWLEFLYRRLSLARDLLREDGVLLVSINDQNRAYMELLLEQIWPGGRKGSLVWRSRIGDNSGKGANLSVNHEHVLVWAGKEFCFLGGSKNYKMYTYKDSEGKYRKSDLTKPHSCFERPNTFYPIHNKKTDIWYPPNPDRVWAFASADKLENGKKTRKETIEELVENEKIIFPSKPKYIVWNTIDELLADIRSGKGPKGGNGAQLIREDIELIPISFWIGKKVGFGVPAYKRYITDMPETTQPLSSWVKSAAEKDFEPEEDAIHIESGFTDEGSKELRRLLGDKAFPYPKPPSLMRGLIDQSTGPGDIVLDFFAGSGTTAQAVVELDRKEAEAAKKEKMPAPEPRRFILVSSTEATTDEPDKNICRDVAARRLAALGIDFAYLRSKVSPIGLAGLAIPESALWPSVGMLLTRGAFREHPKASIEWIEAEGRLVGLVKALNETVYAEIENRPVPKGSTVVLASFQPGLLKQRFSYRDDMIFLSLPDGLVEALLGRSPLYNGGAV
ncbi:MAG: site-specific DNA-methyltransferase [Spirochaetales bacterium]